MFPAERGKGKKGGPGRRGIGKKMHLSRVRFAAEGKYRGHPIRGKREGVTRREKRMKCPARAEGKNVRGLALQKKEGKRKVRVFIYYGAGPWVEAKERKKHIVSKS